MIRYLNKPLPKPEPEKIPGASIFEPAPTVKPSYDIVEPSKPKPPEDSAREQAAKAKVFGASGGGGGGASGKMMFRPRVSQSRISVLRAMLNLPRLK